MEISIHDGRTDISIVMEDGNLTVYRYPNPVTHSTADMAGMPESPPLVVKKKSKKRR